MATKITKSHTSVKHAIIDRTNTNTVVAVAIATFIFVFSIFAVRALIDQSGYYRRVISEKDKALKQLKDNKDAVKVLNSSYLAFVNNTQNILGGNPAGEGPIDGNNANVVLDALPSSYDYPAVSSSFEKILKDGGYEITSIGGTEDSGLSDGAPSAQIVPLELPYAFTFTATAVRTEELLKTLERSIRPMYIDSLRIQVGQNNLQTNIQLHTYFTQEKKFELGTKEVK